MQVSAYQPTNIEKKWANYWEKNNYFSPHGAGQPYCIMLPPPNVTGTLHMGHGFQHTLMDILIRFHRMEGNHTLWQGGTDHAGIATQMVVERQLQKENQTRQGLGREAFLKKVWAWQHHSGDTITTQIKRLGASIDWSRERFTMDNQISQATLQAFIQLYRDGLIYRGKNLVNWDPQLKTAISDLEVATTIEKGHLWYLRYPVIESKEVLIVATTRPETLLGDAAVAVHPEDTRYQHLIGKKIRLPLVEREIPIIGDESVDREFGTGCVKITPAHDFNDYATGKRHNLPLINIFTPDAKLNTATPKNYQGLDRFVARKKIVADLEAAQLLEKVVPYEHPIPHGDRTGAVIEPFLTDQWFICIQTLADKAITAYQNHSPVFIPDHWGKTYLQWLTNIEDWCISRQLWWGHRIPVWYDDAGNHYAGLHEKDVRKFYQLDASLPLHQDEDVLDTWFSASLWPFATLGWPEKTADIQQFFPTQVLITGFDIIFFWVARMVMMSLYFTGKTPFAHTVITGLIRDSRGQKMSKSKGNTLDPIDLIDGISLHDLIEKRVSHLMQPEMADAIRKQTEREFPKGIPESGTDALRFTFCALATQGRDINFDMARHLGYRNFCNKLWNAGRFVLMQTEHTTSDETIAKTLPDQWIQSQLQHTIQTVRATLSDYRFDQLAKTLYEFTWNTFCDWYLELAKCDMQTHASTRHTLLSVFEILLRLLHPIIPYITEEIWQSLPAHTRSEKTSIMIQPYPTADTTKINSEADDAIRWLQNFVTIVRTLRSENNISPAKKITVQLAGGTKNDKKNIDVLSHYLLPLAKIEKIVWQKYENTDGPVSSALFEQLEIYIPLTGLVDEAAEAARLQKEIEKLEKMKTQLEARLNTPGFVDKAPKPVVEAAQHQLKECVQALGQLGEK